MQDSLLFGTTAALLVWRLRSRRGDNSSSSSSSASSLDTSPYVPGNPWWILPCEGWAADPSSAPPPLPAAAAAAATAAAAAALGSEQEQEQQPQQQQQQQQQQQLEFGTLALRRSHFLLEEDNGLAFLNHGSYGATLRPAYEAKAWWLRRMEAQPVRFMDDEVLPALAAAGRRLAAFVGANPTDLALVPNATTAVNAVLRGLPLQPGDVLLSLDISYGACLSSLDYVAKRAGARLLRVRVPWPQSAGDDASSDDALVAAVEAALAAEPRVVFALFDHITSCPAVLLPVARLCAACRARGVRTMVDGAHAVGALPLDVPAVGADAYTSNCHKWLMTPKGTAFLWVAPDDAPGACMGAPPGSRGSRGISRGMQAQTRPTVISHGYGLGFVREFLWAATCDYTPYLGIEAAIDFFEQQGPGRIMAHNRALAARAGAFLAAAWGTGPVLTPPRVSTTMCVVRVPTERGGGGGGGGGDGDGEGEGGPAVLAGGALAGRGVFPPTGEGACALNHALRARGVEVPVFVFGGFLHVRVSAQIYVVWADYEKLAALMVELQCCE